MDKDDISPQEDLTIETGNIRMKVTAYANNLKMIGYVYLNINTRSTARRPSDLLKNFPDKYMTLADTKIYYLSTGDLLEEKQYLIINLNLVEALHAEEAEEGK